MKKNKLQLLLFLFIIFFLVFSFCSVCLAEDTPPADNGGEETPPPPAAFQDLQAAQQEQQSITGFGAPLELNVPILGLIEVKGIVQYLLTIYQTALYIIVPLTVIIVIYGGVLWVAAGFNPENKNKGKDHIIHGFIGLFIALTSYIILSLIGITQLKDITLEQIQSVSFVEPEIMKNIFDSVNSSGAASGTPGGCGEGTTKEQCIATGKEVAKSLGIDPCVWVAKTTMESGCNVSVIGHDENVTRVRTKSRPIYVSSGKKYSGASNNGGEKNDDTKVCDKDDLCLDWRFSHGIGIGQLTFFPKESPFNAKWCKDIISQDFNGECLYPKLALCPNVNIKHSLLWWKKGLSGNDYRTAFRKYNGSGAAAEAYATKAMGIFEKCRSGGG